MTAEPQPLSDEQISVVAAAAVLQDAGQIQRLALALIASNAVFLYRELRRHGAPFWVAGLSTVAGVYAMAINTRKV